MLLKVRVLAGAYEDMSRLFPASGYGDNALWQGAVLAADAFWQFGDAIDRTTALRLFSALTTRFPSQLAGGEGRLADQASPGREGDCVTSPAPAASAAAADAAAAPAPTGLAALPAALTGITREVLPEVLRIVIQLGKEVPFYDERIDGPPRVFLDLQNTRAIEPLKDAVIPFPDDVVKQVRDRAAAELAHARRARPEGDARYSVYTLYDPYRIVVDFERKRAVAPAVEPRLAGVSRSEASARSRHCRRASYRRDKRSSSARGQGHRDRGNRRRRPRRPLIEAETTPPPPASAVGQRERWLLDCRGSSVSASRASSSTPAMAATTRAPKRADSRKPTSSSTWRSGSKRC